MEFSDWKLINVFFHVNQNAAKFPQYWDKILFDTFELHETGPTQTGTD